MSGCLAGMGWIERTSTITYCSFAYFGTEEEEVDLLHVVCVVEHIVHLLVRVFLFVRSQEKGVGEPG